MMEFLAFRLDPVNHCLWRRTDSGADERIRVQPRPFALLRHLVEHAGRLVTEDEILGAVWPKLYVQPESIKTQLHHIRKILGDDPKNPRYIETVQRRGYQFIAPVRKVPAPNVAVRKRSPHGTVVGREPELSALSSYLHEAATGERQVIFVTGEPGIGKTALVDELQQRAVSDAPALRIARGQCIEIFGDTEAYYPILEALGQLCMDPAAASIVEILAAQAPTWLVQFPALLTQRHREMLRQEILGATRERMLREIGSALNAIAADTPLLVVIEDLQWADRSTLDLISAFAHRRKPAKLLLIATSRPIDLLPIEHPLKALKQTLLVQKLCNEIELEPLTEAQVASYLRAGSPPVNTPAGLTELVYRHSGGNALFMVATVDHMTQQGFIAKEQGNWQVKRPLAEIDPGVPETLRQMIEAQLGRLTTEEQRALEVASVQGAVFSPDICAAVSNADAEAHENLYNSMAQRHRFVRAAGIQCLIDGSISSRYEFVHALYREVMYRRQLPIRRAKLHQRIGEALETLYAQQLSDVGSELAHHFEQSADWPRAVRYLHLAAKRAEQSYGHREAITLLQHALEITSRLPEAERSTTEIEILEKLADALYYAIDPNAQQAYDELVTRGARCGAINVEVRALISMGELYVFIDADRSLHALDRAFELSMQQDPLTRARSQAACYFWRSIIAWRDTDATDYANALAEIRMAGDGHSPGQFLVWHGYFLFNRAQYRESRRFVREGLRELTHGSAENPCATTVQIQASIALYLNDLFLGDWGEALREIESATAAVSMTGNYVLTHGMRLWGGWLNHFAMDFDGVQAICQTAAEALGESMIPIHQIHYRILAATAELSRGCHERAWEHLTLAQQTMDRQRVASDWWFRPPLEWASAELWLVRGDLAQARQHGAQFLKTALATAERKWQALAWEVHARIAVAEGDPTLAAERIIEGLSTIEEFDQPPAAWRVHATAAAIYESLDDQHRAERHRTASRSIVLTIANSLPSEQRLRKSFLSAAMRRIDPPPL